MLWEKCCIPPPPDPKIQPFDRSVVGSSLDEDLLPLQSGELYIAGMEYEHITLMKGGENEMTISSLEDVLAPSASRTARFLVEQETDEDIITVTAWCKSGEFPDNKAALSHPSQELELFWLARKNLFVDPSGVLRRRRSQRVEQDQLVVPVSLREEVFADCHDCVVSGHLGVSRTYARLIRHYYWPGMSDFVPDHIQVCGHEAAY